MDARRALEIASILFNCADECSHTLPHEIYIRAFKEVGDIAQTSRPIVRIELDVIDHALDVLFVPVVVILEGVVFVHEFDYVSATSHAFLNEGSENSRQCNRSESRRVIVQS